jgi:tetrapyrrole methylase family protein/MazG family protein/ATP diphosphatase
MSGPQNGSTLPRLVEIMQRLLAPDGCPWDREQSLQTLRPYVIEEAHEVADAIDRGSPEHLREELGDLLLQIVFQSELAQAKGWFGPDDVVSAICDKMVRRHPHVFGDEQATTSAQVLHRWEELKAAEKKDRGALDGVPVALPALLRAQRVGEKAARFGFDWPDATGPRAKISEELAELDEAVASGDMAHASRELGDLLFSITSYARKLGIDAESSLRETLLRFGERVSAIETLAKDRPLESIPADELDRLWDEAKSRGAGGGVPTKKP